MKFFIAAVLLATAASSVCAETCPVGTHAYPTGCGYLAPEATCENPTPPQDTRGIICDYSSCYCDSPTVRDEKTGQCVNLDKCT